MKDVKISIEAERRKRLRLSASFGTIKPISENEEENLYGKPNFNAVF
jgi:hypothetical protein